VSKREERRGSLRTIKGAPKLFRQVGGKKVYLPFKVLYNSKTIARFASSDEAEGYIFDMAAEGFWKDGSNVKIRKEPLRSRGSEWHSEDNIKKWDVEGGMLVLDTGWGRPWRTVERRAEKFGARMQSEYPDFVQRFSEAKSSLRTDFPSSTRYSKDPAPLVRALEELEDKYPGSLEWLQSNPRAIGYIT